MVKIIYHVCNASVDVEIVPLLLLLVFSEILRYSPQVKKNKALAQLWIKDDFCSATHCFHCSIYQQHLLLECYFASS